MAKKAKSKKSATKTAAKKSAKKPTAVAKKRSARKDGRSNPQLWRDKDVERLKKLIMQNTPTPLIAAKLNRSVTSVRGYVQRHGLSLRPTNRSPAD